ncbi:PD-(D/E)XK nuclease-like domain-containing protein [Streptomyces sp. N2-109]|uniref:PD-(D/E)XK nuclease-like domain-containing protein n=1 Tax=Streptomyces gossypii TaxID=2883101 RepID=A0ABT2JT77_9ACTN|nr:PD-(D/E)XK nuclease-like domain-containing protein [Streptomyces gossypii]MCT2591092.1 PD-(D/E)XK nuclease-like domain-containing protein [Streptomyces gossypii]
MTNTTVLAGASAPAAGPAVQQPGIYQMTAEEYHADRGSLSSTGARKLLPPSCPAIFRHEQDNPPAPKKTFDFGHAAHHLVLGDGPDIDVLDFPNYLTKAAKAARDEARDMGAVPMLRHDYEQVEAMADAIRRHPLAGPLFTPGSGVAEQSIFWTDRDTGIKRKARPDWVKQLPGLTLCVDYKTAADASPDGVSKAVQDHGYHQQAAWYLDGLEAAGMADDGSRFIFVFQMKTAPYLVTVRELDPQSLDIGRAKNRRALRVYADCQRTGTWPDWTGPVEEIPSISLPVWAALRDSEEYLSE